ncbi:MAG: hypothetical protein II685_00395 [Clostridia bacterium]|nr:hypothetical protein [Clostridia bacterium]
MKKTLRILLGLLVIMSLIPAAAFEITNHRFFDIESKNVSEEKFHISQNSSAAISENITFIDSGQTKTLPAKTFIRSVTGAAVCDDFEEAEVKATAAAVHTKACFESENNTLKIDTSDKSVFLNENELKQKFQNSFKKFCDCCDSVFYVIITDGQRPKDIDLSFLPSSGKNKLRQTANPYNILFGAADLSDTSGGITPPAAHLMAAQGNTFEEILNYYCSH